MGVGAFWPDKVWGFYYRPLDGNLSQESILTVIKLSMPGSLEHTAEYLICHHCPEPSAYGTYSPVSDLSIFVLSSRP